MKPIKIYQPGEQLVIRKRAYNAEEQMHRKKEVEKVTVIKQYPHHVLVKKANGVRESITNAELYTMGCAKYKAEGEPEKEKVKQYGKRKAE